MRASSAMRSFELCVSVPEEWIYDDLRGNDANTSYGRRGISANGPLHRQKCNKWFAVDQAHGLHRVVGLHHLHETQVLRNFLSIEWIYGQGDVLQEA